MVKKPYFLFIFILAFFQAHSQCTQSLGTPIINETFGAGNELNGPALPVGTTNFKYFGGGQCPQDGDYSIVNSTSGCFGLWNTVTDHTGDPNGYFMLVNASYQPSDFFVQTITGLCDGTTYQFAAWIINMFAVSGGIEPNVTFTIEKTDGTILSTYNTDNIPYSNPGVWSQYGLFFTTPVGVSTIVVRMHNNAPGGYGNDLGLDDITFTPAGPATTIGINGIKGDTLNTACYQNLSFFSNVGSCYLNNSYQWQISADGATWTDIPGANAIGYTPNLSVPGTYFFHLNVAENGNIGNGSCRVNSNIITIIYQVYEPPVVSNISAAICPADPYVLPSGKTVDSTGMYADTVYNSQGCAGTITNLNLTVYKKLSLGPDKNICAGDTVVLNPGTFDSYLWQDGSTSPTYAATKAGVYWVKVTYPNGCTAADSIAVEPIGCLPAKIHNTFTPNGDGVNDTWQIDGLQGYAGCTVFIYNRWGQLVFKSIGYSKPWDGTYKGKNLPFGTYYYVIDLKDNSPRISGNVTIVR